MRSSIHLCNNQSCYLKRTISAVKERESVASFSSLVRPSVDKRDIVDLLRQWDCELYIMSGKTLSINRGSLENPILPLKLVASIQAFLSLFLYVPR